MLVVPGPASLELARKIAYLGNLKMCSVYHKYFPDGESYFRFKDNVKEEDVVVVQGTHPPQERNLMQLLLLISGLIDLGANRVFAIVPYLCYSRQDRMFLSGEVVSLKLVLKLLSNSGIEGMVTVNPHNEDPIKDFKGKIKIVNAFHTLASYFLQFNLKDPIVASPGKKGIVMAKDVADILGAEPVNIKTMRDPETGNVNVEIDSIRAYKRDVIVVDDIISSGGTMAKIVKKFKDMGAERVMVACIHAVMVENAGKKIAESGAELIVATDTVPSPYSIVSVAGKLVESLNKF